jgi:molybdenum cofactor biosynthesis enzyme MoaA
VDEVAELGAAHLAHGVDPILSFGQGCEGEPLLQAPLLAAAIRAIRKVTGRGTINLNTNGGDPEALDALARAGLDSVRVSLISARAEIHAAYHRPRSFGLADVRRSLAVAHARGVFVNLNLLVLPGLTDREEELEALLDLLRAGTVDVVQLRNLNMDPYRLFQSLPAARGRIVGIPHLIATLRTVPGLRIGSFTYNVK